MATEYTKRITNLAELQTELLEHAKDGRGGIGDAGFRLNIALAQIGNLAMHYTHDPKENHIARPYGTKASEISDSGHAIVQLLTYCAVRGIDLEKAINVALLNLRQKDFVARGNKENGSSIVGEVGMPGVARGSAWVCFGQLILPPDTPKNYILVMPHVYSDSRITKFAGIVTDHGGTHCHAAIIAREYGIPCIVGTGRATKILTDGTEIEINAVGGTGTVKVIKCGP